MLPTPPPSRAANARNVSPCWPASSSNETAPVSTASNESEARWRGPRVGRSAPRRSLRFRVGTVASHHTARVVAWNRTMFYYRTRFDQRTTFDTPGATAMTTLPATGARTYPSLRAAWIPLAALCLAFFVEMVDNTLLTVALPTIARDLHSDTTSLQWVTSAYSLTFGSIADRFGRKRVLLYGLAAFGIISLGVAMVSSSGELIALRAALGLAAA